MVDLILWLSANVGDRADVAKNRNKNIPSTGSYDWSKVKFRESIAMLYSYADE